VKQATDFIFEHPYSATENKNSMTHIETEGQMSEIAFLSS
jgi:hypothetical protein